MDAERTLRRLRADAAGCRACPLWEGATQTVFGEGPPDARLMLVGEQPGDQEDKAGHPFVGPAGRVLDRALEEAGIDRGSVFVSNGVKHFKYRMRGKRRIHQRPAAGEVKACRKWLAGEIDAIAPELLVALGATAVYALMGKTVSVREHRGHVLESELFDAPVLVTTHPSSILRERDHDAREAALDALVADLRLAR
jgi:DNA polymerase